MRLAAIASPVLALAIAARSVAANLPGDRGGGAGRGKDKQDGGDRGDGAKTTTLLVAIQKDKGGKGKGRDALAKDCFAAAAAAGGSVAAVHDRVFHGCTLRVPAGRAAASAAALLAADPRVARLEADGTVRASYSWGQDRVDQCALPLSGTGTLTRVDATGVRVYIMDTGIDINHAEFANMMDSGSSCHINAVEDGRTPFDDGNGHG